MSFFVAFAFLFIICLLLKSILEKKNRRLYQLLKQFPSHRTYPLIGNIHLLLNPMDGLPEKFEKIMKSDDRLVFWMGPMPVLILKKYNDIASVMSQCLDRDLLGIGKEWTVFGLLTNRYEEWKISRRALNHAFTSQMLSKYLQVFNKNVSILVENLKSVANTGEEVDIEHWTMKVSLDSILENTMGISIRDNEKSGQEFCEALIEGLMSTTQRINYPWLFSDFVYKLYLKITKKTKIIESLKFLPTQILRKKIDVFEDSQRQNNTGIDDAHSSRTVIDLLINITQTELNFTETRMKDELLQVIAAGVETSSLSLSFLLLMMAINQEAQQKVYEEITQLSTISDHIDGALTENDLNNHLTYLEQCIKETLRIFSPVVLDATRTHKEILLDGKTVPTNVLILTLVYMANRDTELYKNPLKWDPENFSEQAIKERPKCSELIFGYGPRNCIGAKYAMMKLKTEAVYVLRKYHLSTSIKELTNNDLSMDLSIRSKLGYPVKFTSR